MANTIVEARIAASSDDAEERVSNGSVGISSTDLELSEDRSNIQLVGMRFTGLDIPVGAIIVNAYIQFTVDEVSTGIAALEIRGQDSDNAQSFTSADNDISARATTDAFVAWAPPEWTATNASGLDQRTPNIAAVIQEIVDRSGWSPEAALALVISGIGDRTAESFDGDSSRAPLLHIEYAMPDDGVPRIDLDGDNDSGAAGNDFAAAFVAEGGPVAIADADTAITDSDGGTLASATITITNPEAGDVLAAGPPPAGISASLSGDGTVLTLTGVASLADYEAAIKAVTFDNASGTPVTGDRAIEVIVNDGTTDSPAATASVSVALPSSPPPPGTTTTVEARVAASTDDAEENTNTNSVNLSSTDLELAIDGSRNQIIGMRFGGLDIPPGVVILNAYIQFTVDEVSTGAVALEIRGEDTDNAQTFSKTNANISSRADTDASVAWAPPDWNSVGESGLDQRTPDLSAVIQEIIDRSGWSADAAIALTISGTGKRTAESFDGTSGSAPLLHIEYTVPDAGAPVIDLDGNDDSGALGNDFATAFLAEGGPVAIADTDTVITDSDGTTIVSARITLTNAQAGDVLAAAGPLPGGITASFFGTTLTLSGAASLADYGTAIAQITYDNTSATLVAGDRVIDVVVNDGAHDSLAATATVTVTPPNAAPVAQDDAIDATGGVERLITASELTANDSDGDGDPLVITSVTAPGHGTAVLNPDGTVSYTATDGYVGADSFDYTIDDGNGGSASATVTVNVAAVDAIQTVESRISASTDDAEENASSNSVNRSSTDLEFADDGSRNQVVGMRFSGLDIPPGVVITAAYVQFTVDEVSTGLASLTISGEDTDSALGFSGAAGDITSRPTTTASAAWAPPDWTAVGANGEDQRTSDLSSIVQEIIDRPGWNSGNAIGLSILGSGKRTAESFDGGAAKAPLLHIEYTFGPGGTPTVDLDDDDSSGAAGRDYATAFVPQGDPVAIADADIIVADGDSATLASARVTILNPEAGDTLAAGTLPGGIAWSFDGTTLTLTGTATPADYATAIQSITFHNPSALPVTGDRTIEVIVNDGDTDSAAATATVSIAAPNAAPTAVADAITAVAGAARVIASSELTGNDSDPDGDALTITSVTAPSHGGVVLNPDGTITYTGTPGYTGPDSFEYTVSDGNGGTASASVSVDVVELGRVISLDYQVSASSDDAEEKISTGTISLTSSDIELSTDGRTDQVVGMRFNGLDIPANAVIVSAFLQFTTDENSTGAASLEIRGEASDNAPTFSEAIGDISSRPVTNASVTWAPKDWTDVGDSGPRQQTSDLSDIIQEIIDRPGWSTGGSVALTMSGSGRRTAEAFNGDSSAAPRLHIEYALPADGVPWLDLDSDNSSGANGGGFSTSFAVGGAPVLIADVDAVVNDSDDATLVSATITITNAEAGDVLAPGNTPVGISAVLSPDGATLTLTGDASLADYEAAIKSTTFDNPLGAPATGDRFIDVIVNDGATDSVAVTTQIDIQSQGFDFLVIADSPYRSSEKGLLEDILLNVSPDTKFVIHLGDVVSGSSDIDPDTYFTEIATIFDNSPKPFFIILGDNEFNDQPDPDPSFARWKDSFLYYDQNWTHDLGTIYQDLRPENFSFVVDDTLFIGINHVGGSTSDSSEFANRQADNLAWLTDMFGQFGSTASNAVIFAHAQPNYHGYPGFDADLRVLVREFDKPILWLQGDKHHWSLDPEYFGTAPNLTRVILERTGPGDPLLVSVTDDPDDPFDSDHSFGGQFL